MLRPSPRQLVRSLVVVLNGFLVSVACSSSGGSGGTGPTPAIAISLGSSSASVVQGGSTQVQATLTRSGGFTGTVDLNVTGAPAGVTGAAGNVQTSGNVTTAAITISVAGTTTPGTYNLTVVGSGSGVSNATAAFTLTVTATAVSNFTLSMSVGAGSVAPGGNTAPTININRTNGLTAGVDLTVTGQPTGVTATPAPASTTTNASTLTITVGATTAPGQYVLTVHGNSTGLAEQTTTFTLTVTGSFTLSMSTGAGSVAQGGNTAPTININRSGGLGASVALTVTGQPAGVTATPTPAGTTANASTLNITVGGATVPGQYVLTVHGNTPGVTEQTTTFTLTVTAAGTGTSYTISFGTCPAAAWLAYNNDGGPWTVATITGNSAPVTWSGDKVGLAWAGSVAGRSLVFVNYMAKADLATTTINLCATATAGTNRMDGNVTGLAVNDVGLISIGGSVNGAVFPGGAVSIFNVLSGVQDMFAFRHSSFGAPNPNKLVIRRDIAVTNAGSLGAVIDFNGGEAVAPATATITVGNAPAGGVVTQTMNYQSGGSCAYANFYTETVAGTSFTASGVPAGLQRGTDIHNLLLSAHAAGDNTNNETFSDYFHTLADHTDNFGGLLPAPVISTPAGSYKRLEAVFTAPTAYDVSQSLTYSDAGVAHQAAISATHAYLNGFSADLIMPDFHGLAGWNDSWMPASAAIVTWQIGANGGTTNLLNVCGGGDSFLRAASRQGSI